MRRYHAGRLRPLVKIIAAIVARRPEMAENTDYIISCLVSQAPSIGNQKTCFNCDGSMEEYIFEFDCLDALMLLEMAKVVKEKMKKWTASFTDANKVHVPSMQKVSYAMKSRTTQMSKLGLIAKVLTPEGSQQQGMWLITKRGWSALRSEAVPKSVVSWNGKIEERTEEMTTIANALSVHIDWAERHKKEQGGPRDHSELAKKYNPEEWREMESGQEQMKI